MHREQLFNHLTQSPAHSSHLIPFSLFLSLELFFIASDDPSGLLLLGDQQYQNSQYHWGTFKKCRALGSDPDPFKGFTTLPPLFVLCIPPIGGHLWNTSMKTSGPTELGRFENH